VRAADFDFDLPPDRIAQRPTDHRDASRILILNRDSGTMEHTHFPSLLHHLKPGDVLVLNDSRVIPARLRACHPRTGRAFEILLLEENRANDWWVMMRPAKRAPIGTTLTIADRHRQPVSVTAMVVDRNAEGHRRLIFAGVNDFNEVLEELGETPLPHYIKREGETPCMDDEERYQTVYAQNKGSVAAPTAGLHFTNEMLGQIRARGIEVCSVTLHVGPGTFAPVKTESIENHTMHHERFHVGEEAARKVNAARSTGRRVIAVGTTTVRVLESLARDHHGRIVAGMGRTNIFIFPPFEFRIVDALVTNFHLPRSTLLMLVSAFAAPGKLEGREKILAAYEEAVKQHYRFFSYGDAMLIA
jgi:S-adenosylmethionine:tRNA ribosyltransferase-isomerase